MLGASTSSGNATRLSVSVPASQGALVCLLKVLCNGEANTDDCSPDPVIQYMDMLLHRNVLLFAYFAKAWHTVVSNGG